MIKHRSINTELFEEFLRLLRKKNKKQRLAIFMDNLSVHKTLRIRSVMQELNMEQIFSEPYSP